MRTSLCGVIAAMTLLGCSKQAAGDSTADAGDSASTAAERSAPARDDACALISLAEIRRVLPETARSEGNESLAEHGIDACAWYGSGKASVLEVSVWDVSGADDTPEENVRTLAMGIADPTRPGAEGSVRIEKVAGVGEEAFAIVEKADDARGILSNGALLSLKKNGRIVTVASGFVAFDDRAKALEQLTTLGKSVATRL